MEGAAFSIVHQTTSSNIILQTLFALQRIAVALIIESAAQRRANAIHILAQVVSHTGLIHKPYLAATGHVPTLTGTRAVAMLQGVQHTRHPLDGF
jgi:hypothetical protein